MKILIANGKIHFVERNNKPVAIFPAKFFYGVKKSTKKRLDRPEKIC